MRAVKAAEPGALAVVLAVLILVPGVPVAADDVTTSLACTGTDEVVELTTDTLLDPDCTYPGGFRITTSGVTLDCRGARIADPGGPGHRRGIEVSAPVDVALHDITIRNCEIEGYLNSIRLTRDGFRDLAEGAEYEHAWSDIVVEQSTIRSSHGVGIFVDGYVTDVTIRNNLITHTGSSGIYLETGSASNTVIDNEILDNGYEENGPGGQSFELGELTFYWWGVGREGIAVDGSRFNHIARNHFEGNSSGGILLYKNCGEYPDSGAWFDRRYGSHGNLIEANVFDGGHNGVWVGSRMAENTMPMECTDPAYVTGPFMRIVLDQAKRNTVRDNVFDGVTHAIRLEDDDTVVRDNLFRGPDPGHHAVTIGTKYRTEVLGRPVAGTVLEGNVSHIVDNPSPYRWVHGHTGTVEADNLALGDPAELCEGEPIPRSPFIFVIQVVIWDPTTPPPQPPPDLSKPELGPLEPCSGARPSPQSSATTPQEPRPSTAGSTPSTGGDARTARGATTPTATPVGATPAFTG